MYPDRLPDIQHVRKEREKAFHDYFTRSLGK